MRPARASRKKPLSLEGARPSPAPLKIPARHAEPIPPNPQIHVSKATAPEEHPKSASQAVKLMHRFTVDDVKSKMDHVEKA